MVPRGADVLEPVGTAPGLVVPVAEGRSGPPVVVLPGPPGELRPMWPRALDCDAVRTALSGREEIRQHTLRLWGIPESELAATMRALDLRQLEITTCLRDGELEIVTRYAPDAQSAYDSFAAAVAGAHRDTLYSPDGRTVDDIVADTLLERGLTIATAESCTAGLLAGRLTDRAGSSEYVLGGLVVYSNEAKHDLAGVPAKLIERVGAVSAEVASALAAGARERLGADLGVGITGIAGPDGGTPDKPVGTVHFCASTAERSVDRKVRVPGSRADVRTRSVTIALHLVRSLLGV
jgi:nicotinamide-nucleotide amidase